MVYGYNPTHSPQLYGPHTFPPNNYFVVSEEIATAVKQTSIPVLFEDQADFPPLWLTWPDTNATRRLIQ